MGLRTIKDMKKAIDGSKSRLTDLRTRFENDYGLYRLEAYNRGIGYESVTRNEPKTLVNKVISLLSSAERTIRIPLAVDNEKERKAKSNAERFIIGSFNLIDSRLQSFLQPSLQEQEAFFATIRGWFAIRAYIRTGKNGNVIPDIAVWDILNTDFVIGDEGVSWVCHHRTATPSQIEAEYGITTRGQKITVYDWWDDEIYNTFIDDKFVIEPKKHKLGHLPVLVTQVGSVPFIQSDKFTDTIKDSGESVLAPNRGLIPSLNKMISDYQTIIDHGVHNPAMAISKDGKPFIPEGIYKEGSVVNISRDKGQEIAPLYQPIMPKDAEVLWSAYNRMWEIGGLSPLAYGLLERDVSGYGISLLHHASESILMAPKKTMERSEEWLARELLTQYANGKFGKLKLHGREGTNEDFDVELQPKDVKGDWFPKVELKASLPEDEAARYTMAQIAIQSELLSRETARDRLLGVQDTDAETQKVMREKAMNMPAIMLRQMASSLILEGRPDLAQVFLDEIKAQETKPQMSEVEKRRSEAVSEAVRPEFAQGITRNVLPMEEMGQTPRTPEQRQMGG